MNQELIGRLESQLDRLMMELTPDNPSGRGGMGSEDPAEREERLQRQIRHLKKVLEELPQLGPAMLHRDRVGFGSELRLEDLRSGKVLSYTIMTGDSIDIDAGEVSIASPIGHALLGRRPGEEVEVMTPQGVRRFRILSITTLFDDEPRTANGSVPATRSAPKVNALAARA